MTNKHEPLRSTTLRHKLSKLNGDIYQPFIELLREEKIYKPACKLYDIFHLTRAQRKCFFKEGQTMEVGGL